jgi:hypothetical protein
MGRCALAHGAYHSKQSCHHTAPPCRSTDHTTPPACGSFVHLFSHTRMGDGSGSGRRSRSHATQHRTLARRQAERIALHPAVGRDQALITCARDHARGPRGNCDGGTRGEIQSRAQPHRLCTSSRTAANIAIRPVECSGHAGINNRTSLSRHAICARRLSAE